MGRRGRSGRDHVPGDACAADFDNRDLVVWSSSDPMGVLVKHLPEHGVTLYHYSGAITPEAAVQSIGSFRGGRQVHYVDQTADLSGLSVGFIPELKHAADAKLREVGRAEPVVPALVSPSGGNASFLQFWCSYVGADRDHPVRPAEFSSIKAACEWLRLSETACDALSEAVESEPAVRSR